MLDLESWRRIDDLCFNFGQIGDDCCVEMTGTWKKHGRIIWWSKFPSKTPPKTPPWDYFFWQKLNWGMVVEWVIQISSVKSSFSTWASWMMCSIIFCEEKNQLALWHWRKTNWSRWWFETFFIFTPKIGEHNPIWLYNIFQMGWNHQLVMNLSRHFVFFSENWGSLGPFFLKKTWQGTKVLLSMVLRQAWLLYIKTVSIKACITGSGCFFV